MVNSMATFFEMPAWMREMERQQRMWESISRPLAMMQMDSMGMANNLMSAVDCQALRDMRLLAEQCTPAMVKMLQQEQAILKMLSPLNELQAKLSDQMLGLSRNLFDTGLYQYDALRRIREKEVTRWAEAADFVANMDEISECNPDELRNLSEADQQDIASEVTAILADEKNWEQRLVESMAKFQHTHPVWAAIIKMLILDIIVAIAVNLASTELGQTVSAAKVYSEPSAASQIICNIEQYQTVVIVGDVPYYYEVEIRDEDEERTKAGYISKRVIRVESIYSEEAGVILENNEDVLVQ